MQPSDVPSDRKAMIVWLFQQPPQLFEESYFFDYLLPLLPGQTEFHPITLTRKLNILMS